MTAAGSGLPTLASAHHCSASRLCGRRFGRLAPTRSGSPGSRTVRRGDEPGPILGQRLPVPDQLAELTVSSVGNERRPQQSMSEEIGQPLGVADIGLPAGDSLDVARIDNQQLKVGRLEQVVDALPCSIGAPLVRWCTMNDEARNILDIIDHVIESKVAPQEMLGRLVELREMVLDVERTGQAAAALKVTSTPCATPSQFSWPARPKTTSQPPGRQACPPGLVW
jgi:hypothetical protein